MMQLRPKKVLIAHCDTCGTGISDLNPQKCDRWAMEHSDRARLKTGAKHFVFLLEVEYDGIDAQAKEVAAHGANLLR